MYKNARIYKFKSADAIPNSDAVITAINGFPPKDPSDHSFSAAGMLPGISDTSRVIGSNLLPFAIEIRERIVPRAAFKYELSKYIKKMYGDKSIPRKEKAAAEADVMAMMLPRAFIVPRMS